MFVPVCIYEYVMCMESSVSGQRLELDVFLSQSVFYLLGSLLNLDLKHFISLTSQFPLGIPHLCLPSTELNAGYHTFPGSCPCAGEVNSRPHAMW